MYLFESSDALAPASLGVEYGPSGHGSLGDYDDCGCDNCDDCMGLSGIGQDELVSSTPTGQMPSLVQTVVTEIERIVRRPSIPGSGQTYPIQTPPYLPSYPTNTGTYSSAPPPSMFAQSSNWLPYAVLGGLALIVLSRR